MSVRQYLEKLRHNQKHSLLFKFNNKCLNLKI